MEPVTGHRPSGFIMNTSADDILLGEDKLLNETTRSAIQILMDVPPGLRREFGKPWAARKHGAELEKRYALEAFLLRTHSEGQLLMSPLRFATSMEHCFPPRTVSHLAEGTPLGDAFLSDPTLRAAAERPQNEITFRNYEVAFHRVVASLGMACWGARHPREIPAAKFSEWLALFRTNDGLRWHQELWSSGHRPYAMVALRAVALAYARLADRPEIAAQVPQKRSDSNQLRFWADFTADTPVHLEEWYRAFRVWRKSVRGRTASQSRTAFLQFCRFLDDCFAPADVRDPWAFLARSERPDFVDWLTKQRSGDSRLKLGTSMVNVVNEMRRFSDFLVDQGRPQGNQSPLVGLTDARSESAARRAAGPSTASRASQAKSTPLPIALYNLARQVLEEGENGWPGRQRSCRARVAASQKGTIEVYCPVLPTIFLTEFELPLRIGQTKRLDSGEGDVRRYNAVLEAWETNFGAAAGYWALQNPPQPDAGYAREFPEGSFTGFSVNTNKTGEPYCVPWPHKALHRMLYDLRLWQEKYNPISTPIPPEAYVDDVDRTETEKLSELPSIFPLFRLPPGMHRVLSAAPPNARKTNQFWQDLMWEVQLRWNTQNPTQLLSFVKKNKKSGQYYGCVYKPHGLRVRGLTLLYDAGVPIDVLSAVVAGHKTLLMTIYYLKRSPSWYADQLQEAAKSRSAAAQRQSLAELRGVGIAAAAERAAALDQAAIGTAVSIDETSKARWSDVGIGICPYAGTRCNDGGPLLRKMKLTSGQDRSVFGPVEGGSRNCVNCRHFFTGPAWILPLQIYGTREIRNISHLQEKMNTLHSKIEQLYSSLPEHTVGNERDEKHTLIVRCEEELQDIGKKQAIHVKTFWNTKRYLEACVKLQSVSEMQNDTELVAVGDGIGGVNIEEGTDFEQAAVISLFSEIYPILQNDDADSALERLLERIVFDQQLDLASLDPLDPALAKRAMKASARYLLEKLSREELHALSERKTTLQQLGHRDGAVAAAEVTFGKPISTRSLIGSKVVPSPTVEHLR